MTLAVYRCVWIILLLPLALQPTVGFGLSNNILPFFPISIFSLPTLEDLFLLPLSIFSRVFPFLSSLPVLEWRSFWASYPPPFSLDDLTSLQDVCECLHKLKKLVPHTKTRQQFLTPCVRKQFSRYSPHVLRTSFIIFLSIRTHG